VCVRASELFCQRLLEYAFVERKVGYQSFQPRVLLLELLQSSHLTRRQTAVLGAPPIEGRLADAVLPAQLVNRDSCLCLLYGIHDLLVRKLGFSHRSLLPSLCENPHFRWLNFLEAGHPRLGEFRPLPRIALLALAGCWLADC